MSDKTMAEVAKECGFNSGAELSDYANMTTQTLRNLYKSDYRRFCYEVEMAMMHKVRGILSV